MLGARLEPPGVGTWSDFGRRRQKQDRCGSHLGNIRPKGRQRCDLGVEQMGLD